MFNHFFTQIKSKRHKGVTLIELMVVLGVIAFLSVLIVSFLRLQVFKANDAKRKTEMRRIGIAIEEYEKDHDCYPLPSQVICNPGTGLLPYLDKIQCDPVAKASYLYEHEDSVCPKWYRLYTKLENESDVDYLDGVGPSSLYTYYYASPNAPLIEPTGTVGGGDDGTVTPTYYGCFSGVCTVIQWDPSIPGPECEPYFGNSTCYSACRDSNSLPQNQCN